MSADTFLLGSKLPSASTHPLKRLSTLAQQKCTNTHSNKLRALGLQRLRARCQGLGKGKGHYHGAILVRPHHRHHWITGSAKAIPTVTHPWAKQTIRLRRSSLPILSCGHGRACQDFAWPIVHRLVHRPRSLQIPPLFTPFPKTEHGLPMIDCLSLNSPHRATTM